MDEYSFDMRNESNRHWLPIDVVRYIEDLILKGEINPQRMVVVCHEDGEPLNIFNSNIDSLESVGLLQIAQQAIIDDSVYPPEDEEE